MALFSESAVSVARTLLDIVYPPLCFMCRGPVADPHGLCAECWMKITFLDGPCCLQCGLPFDLDPGEVMRCAGCLAKPPAFDRARSVVRYNDASRDPILALKHADRLETVPAFSRWLKRSGHDLLEDCELIVPVPLHRTRLWRRRYNQAALLTQALARASGKPADPLALIRIKATLSQGEMVSAKARRRNVRGVFRVPPQRSDAVKGRAVLLVDDVMTTGATVDACARALKRAGAARVCVLTLARVVRPLSVAI